MDWLAVVRIDFANHRLTRNGFVIANFSSVVLTALKVVLMGSGSRHDGECGMEVIPAFLFRNRFLVLSIARSLLTYTVDTAVYEQSPRALLLRCNDYAYAC